MKRATAFYIPCAHKVGRAGVPVNLNDGDTDNSAWHIRGTEILVEQRAKRGRDCVRSPSVCTAEEGRETLHGAPARTGHILSNPRKGQGAGAGPSLVLLPSQGYPEPVSNSTQQRSKVSTKEVLITKGTLHRPRRP